MHAKLFDNATGDLIASYPLTLNRALHKGAVINAGPFKRYLVHRVVNEHRATVFGIPIGKSKEPAGIYVEERYPEPFRERLVREMDRAA